MSANKNILTGPALDEYMYNVGYECDEGYKYRRETKEDLKEPNVTLVNSIDAAYSEMKKYLKECKDKGIAK